MFFLRIFLLVIITTLCSVKCESTVLTNRVESLSSNDDEFPLFLTPFIENGSIFEAREAAAVTSPLFSQATSFSGLFTVNKTLNKNLFGWFFPSENPEDPVMLWLQGGPGLTSSFGLFSEIGPFKIDEDATSLVTRNLSWIKDHSILFVDNPVGTGYSFTSDPQGLAHEETQIAAELYEVLRQFFLMFPEFAENDFFIAGESYAGKYVPAVSYEVFRRNNELSSSKFKINLKGLSIGNGWLDPINQMNIGEYAFQYGLVDSRTKKQMDEFRDQSIALFHEGKFVESTLVQRNISKVLKKASGFQNMYNILFPKKQNTTAIITSFLQRNDVRKAIHVGNLTFNSDDPVDKALLYDIMISQAEVLQVLLENYRVLIYSGQLDLAVPYPTTVNYLEKLKFSGAEAYAKAERNTWYLNGEIAGYVKTAANLTEVLVLNAGHLVPTDKPEAAYDLIRKFTRNEQIIV